MTFSRGAGGAGYEPALEPPTDLPGARTTDPTLPGRRPGVIRRHKALFALLALASVLLAGVTAWAGYLNQQISDITRIDLSQPSALGPGLVESERPERATGAAAGSVNILVAGVDAGQSSSVLKELEKGEWVPGSHRSDAIMVVHIDADRESAYVISIPRDTWVNIDGYGPAKINAALSFGGPALFVRTLEQFTGLRMDHLAIIDWNGFKDVTDALAGVRLAYAAKDGSTPTTVELDGEEALDYVRERYSLPRGDLDRTHRQHNVMRALSREALSAGTLYNPLKVTELLDAVARNIAVDEGFTTEKMRELVLSLRDTRSRDVTYLNVPITAFDSIDGQSVVLVDGVEAQVLFEAAAADELEEYVDTHDVDLLPKPSAVP